MREHTGASLAVAGGVVVFLSLFAGVLVAIAWLSICVYAVVKLIGGGADPASPTVVALLVVGCVTALVLGLALVAWFVGRGMVSRKRAD